MQKGQVLLRVQSADIAGAFSDYQKAVADEQLTRTQLERADLLYAKGAISLNDLQVAQDTDAKAKVDVKTTAEKLRLLGNTDLDSALRHRRDPRSGFRRHHRSAGDQRRGRAEPGSPNPFTISDLTYVWILCDVYENDLSIVHLGERADIRLNAYPNQVFTGVINNIGPVLDPNIRTAKVRIEVRNPGLMRVGMFVTATFHGQRGERARPFPPRPFCICTTGIGFMSPPGQEIPASRSEGRRHAAREHAGNSFRAGARPAGGDATRSNSRTRWNSNDPSHRRLRAQQPLHRSEHRPASFCVGHHCVQEALPVEAYPDVANTWVQVITQWPGRAAEEVEQQVTDSHRNPDERDPASAARALGFAGRSVGGESDFRRRFRQRLGPPESAGAAGASDAAAGCYRADRPGFQPDRLDLLVHAEEQQSRRTT